MLFGCALDAVFELPPIVRQLFGHFVGSARHIATDCGLDVYGPANLKFMRWHRTSPLCGPRARLDMARVATAAGSEIRHFVMAITSAAGTTNNVGDLRMSFALTNWSPAALMPQPPGASITQAAQNHFTPFHFSLCGPPYRARKKSPGCGSPLSARSLTLSEHPRQTFAVPESRIEPTTTCQRASVGLARGR
jgi:hypothetical protein